MRRLENVVNQLRGVHSILYSCILLSFHDGSVPASTYSHSTGRYVGRRAAVPAAASDFGGEAAAARAHCVREPHARDGQPRGPPAGRPLGEVRGGHVRAHAVCTRRPPARRRRAYGRAAARALRHSVRERMRSHCVFVDAQCN